MRKSTRTIEHIILLLLSALWTGSASAQDLGSTLLTTFTNPTPVVFDEFGTSVAAGGNDRVVIGGYQDDSGRNIAGAAYLFAILYPRLSISRSGANVSISWITDQLDWIP
jgi:hypothetical protein